MIFSFFTETWTISFTALRWLGDDTNLTVDINILKMAVVKKAFGRAFLKVHSIRFLMVCSLLEFAHVALELLIVKA